MKPWDLKKQLSMCHGDEKQCWHQSWDFWSMSRFTLALQLILSDKPSARTHTTSIDCWRWGFGLAMRHQTLRFEEKQLSMCHRDEKQCWHQSWDFWSMSRFTLALQLILSDKPSAHTHTSSIDCESGGLNLLWDQTLRFEKNSWACVTVTKNSVGTRAETFGQWADLHWLSNWFWVTNQAHAHTHNQYRLLKVGFGLAMRHQTLRFEEKQLSMCHGDEKQCWHQSWDFWSMSRFTLALQLILSDKPSARTHTQPV